MSYIFDNTKLVLSIFFVISLLMVYAVLKKRGSPLAMKDFLYVGHIFLLTLILFGVYTIVYHTLSFRQETKKFNVLSWKSNVEKRVEIIDDLIESNLLISKGEGEIINMLGQPIRIKKKEELLSYYLGFRNKAFTIDPEFLMIEFKNGLSTRCYIKLGVPY